MKSCRWAISLALVAFMCSLASGSSSQMPAPGEQREWADWVEPSFPFFSSVIDAGHAGAGFPARNLTPRGLVLRIGRDQWVGFDTDLLRVAAIWRGTGVTPKALAPGSYRQPDRKTPGGQTSLPEPAGRVWLANGLYPGWQIGDRPALDDPREPAPSPEEVGRGPLPAPLGRFKAVHHVRGGVVLEYMAGGADVREHFTVSERNGQWTLVRRFRVSPSSRPLWLMLGAHAEDIRVRAIPESLALERHVDSTGSTAAWTARVPSHGETIDFSVEFTNGAAFSPARSSDIPSDAAPLRWREEITTRVRHSRAKDPYVVDDIAMLGPTLKGLYGSERTYARGSVRVVADEAYLRESILDPMAKVVSGYERGESGMPSYAGVLSQAQVESIVLYIKSLR